MAGGYRCSLGHTWHPPNGSEATACPECGDTALVVVAEQPVFVLSGRADLGGSGATVAPGGQDVTGAFSVPPAHDEPPTVVFHPPDTPADTPDPSFSSLAGLPPSSGSGRGDREPSSVVPFGVRDAAEFVPPRVAGYEILYEVGRGGMGVVYKARQLNLNRTVALKMILSGAHAGPNERDRFKREAEAVAALQHPHIVQIFEIGDADGHPYLALEFVEGGSLAQRLDGTPWNDKRAAELTETLARAMQFAHEAGIVHRDLKPGNVLLSAGSGQHAVGSKDQDSKTALPSLPTAHRTRPTDSPKVTDFGLAKRLDETLGGDAGTRTGAVMGTPSYIAPEQASGRTRDVGPAADVYALGAILYELLTGRPPFRGETPLDTVLQVLHDDPVPPKRLHPLVPRDLETICLKCLSKQPAKRYANASALADDLRRFLNGEPIKARPLSAWGRGVKWARRHPSLAVLMTATAAATVALVTVLSVAYFRVRDAVDAKERERIVAKRERDRAEAEKLRAEELVAENKQQRNDAVERAEELKREAQRTRRAAYALQLAQVSMLCERDPLRAATLLEDETRCPPDLRDFAWAYLRRLCQRDDRAYLDHGAADPLRAVAYSPDGAFVATAGDSGRVRVWDPRTGRTWITLTGHEGAASGLAFSPDGTAVASAGADGTVCLWLLPLDVIATARKTANALPWLPPLVDPIIGVPDIRPAIVLEAHEKTANDKGVTCVAFAPDGRALVSGGEDGFLRWWDLTAWRSAAPDHAALGGPGATAAALTRMTQSPDARPVWERHKLFVHPGGVRCAAFAPNGKFLVSGGNDRVALVLSPDGGKLVRTLPLHAEAVRAVAVSPDGLTVATTNNGKPAQVRLFDTRTWRDRRLFGHAALIYTLAFSDDGQLLASSGFDKTVRLWDVEDGRERAQLVGHAQGINAIAFAPDRRTIVSAGADGAAVVWQTSTRTHEADDLLRFPRDPSGKQPPQALMAVGMNRAGGALVGVDDIGRVRMVAVDSAPPGERPVSGPFALTPLPFRLPTARVTSEAATVSPDGRTFVVAVETGLLVWQPTPSSERPGQPRPAPRSAFTRPVLVKTPLTVRALGIDPTGRWLVTIDADGVRKYDIRTIPVAADHPLDLKGGELVLAVADAGEVAFHPTREWVAVGIGGGVRVVNFQGKVVAEVTQAHGKPQVAALAFDPTGTHLATGDASGLIKLWAVSEAGGLTFAHDLTGHSGAVRALAFSPNGRTLASGSDDRTVILWDPVTGRERLALTGHADHVLEVAFSADGAALVSVSRDGAVKRWRADSRATPNTGPRLPAMLPRM